MSKCIQTSLLGQQLVVCNWCDRMWECEGRTDGPDGEVAVRAAGSRAGTGVIDVGHQRVGRGADHGLQVDAGIRDWRDGQRSLPANPRRQSGTGETGHVHWAHVVGEMSSCGPCLHEQVSVRAAVTGDEVIVL